MQWGIFDLFLFGTFRRGAQIVDECLCAQGRRYHHRNRFNHDHSNWYLGVRIEELQWLDFWGREHQILDPITQGREKVSILQPHLAKQEAHQRITKAPETGQRHVPLLHHLQRTLRIEENVCPFPGSEGHESECAV